MAEVIRPCSAKDFEAILSVINAAARAYDGVIPRDRYHDPYMPCDELRAEIEAGVRFWGAFDDEVLTGVMGIQEVDDATLIRHAYVRPDRQRGGVGGRLLARLLAQANERPGRPLLVGTWADAWWAVRFYERSGFRLVTPREKERLLHRYWAIPERQVATSVVLVREHTPPSR